MEVVLLTFCIVLLGCGHIGSVSAQVFPIPLRSRYTDEAGYPARPVVNYYGVVQIGTPPKPFLVQFDLDLEDSWVPDYDAVLSQRHHKAGYQCRMSSSCQTRPEGRQTTYYQGCKMNSMAYNDIAELQSSNNANANISLDFKSVHCFEDGVTFSKLPVDGFIGLSRIPANRIVPGKRFVESFHEAGLIASREFSLWFSSGQNDPDAGELVMGGVNRDKFRNETVVLHDIKAQLTGWVLNLNGVFLSQEKISCPRGGCKARLSTGMSDITGPLRDVQSLYAKLGGVQMSAGGVPLVDCARNSTLPTLYFKIDEQHYALPPSAYLRETKVGWNWRMNTCYIGILPSSSPDEWVLGTHFLLNYYTIFDGPRNQVGLAPRI